MNSDPWNIAVLWGKEFAQIVPKDCPIFLDSPALRNDDLNYFVHEVYVLQGKVKDWVI